MDPPTPNGLRRSQPQNGYSNGNGITEKSAPPVNGNGTTNGAAPADILPGPDSYAPPVPDPAAYSYALRKRQLQLEKRRRNSTIASSVLFFLAWIFLILVQVGMTHPHGALKHIFYLKIDLSNVFPLSVPNAVLINSIARSLGLSDFYFIGLWNHCEAVIGEGFTKCDKPKAGYWFNPVAVIEGELLAGATIALPTQVTNILHLVRLASNLIFSFYFISTILSFFNTFLVLLPISRFAPRYSFSPSNPRTCFLFFVISLSCFLTALFAAVAGIICTVVFVILRNAITSQDDLNIKAELGAVMMGLTWTATACMLAAWGMQFTIMLGDWWACCCGRRKDGGMAGRKPWRWREKEEFVEVAVSAVGEGEGWVRRRFLGRRKGVVEV